MKKIVTGLILFMVVLVTNGQNKHDTLILDFPESWSKELIYFPLSFAPELDYTGIEDIRFMNGWSNIESEEFWSYVFVWYVDSIMLTEEILKRDMEKYFNGLMKESAQEAGIIIDSLNTAYVGFKKEEERYTGKIKVFDAFFCKEIITLNVTVEYLFCDKTRKHAVLFRLSPKRFEHRVWNALNQRSIVLKCTE